MKKYIWILLCSFFIISEAQAKTYTTEMFIPSIFIKSWKINSPSYVEFEQSKLITVNDYDPRTTQLCFVNVVSRQFETCKIINNQDRNMQQIGYMHVSSGNTCFEVIVAEDPDFIADGMFILIFLNGQSNMCKEWCKRRPQGLRFLTGGSC